MTLNGKRKKRPSMQDVASLAGVSRTTVSFVLNNVESANISKETKERVLSAAASLNYRRNALASSLRSQKTQTIGFISDHIASTPYASRIIVGAQERAWVDNYLLFLVNTGDDKEMKKAAVNALLDRQVDGIIYATMYHREVHPPENLRDVPAVLLDCFIADRSLPSVVPDEVRGGYEATRYLLEKGHRRIAYLCDTSGVPAIFGRLEGYKKALSEFDIEIEEELIFFHGHSKQSGGYEGTLQLLQLATPPTAIFCFNDRMAMGAYTALHQHNLSVPRDMAIVGFDNQDLIAADLAPDLTTMELPHLEMGNWAVNHLLSLIREQESGRNIERDAVQQTLHCPLIVRNSV